MHAKWRSGDAPDSPRAVVVNCEKTTPFDCEHRLQVRDESPRILD